MNNRLPWFNFWLLSLIWGSSYLFIRISVAEIPPFQLVFIRTVIAAVGLTAVVYLRGFRLPTDWMGIRDVAVLGLVNTAIPFTLISWGETRIESSLASILQGTTALFTFILAHFMFTDERANARKLVGLVIGFLGVIVLAGVGGSAEAGGAGESGRLLGQLALVASSFFYAVGAVYGRKVVQGRLNPVVIAAGAMIVASLFTGTIAYFFPAAAGGAPVSLGAITAPARWSILVLGVVNTFGAYLIFYSLIAALGSSRTAMITYIMPVVGLVLGVVFLDEPLGLQLIVGGILILVSITVVNYKGAARLKRSSQPAA